MALIRRLGSGGTNGWPGCRTANKERAKRRAEGVGAMGEKRRKKAIEALFSFFPPLHLSDLLEKKQCSG